MVATASFGQMRAAVSKVMMVRWPCMGAWRAGGGDAACFFGAVLADGLPLPLVAFAEAMAAWMAVSPLFSVEEAPMLLVVSFMMV